MLGVGVRVGYGRGMEKGRGRVSRVGLVMVW